MGKTLDKQTLQFLTAIANSLPVLQSGNMQQWIEHPQHLKQLLRRSFAGAQYPDFTDVNRPGEASYPLGVDDPKGGLGNIAEWELPLECCNIHGTHPFKKYNSSPALRIGLEYEPLHEVKSIRIRPHLTLWDNDIDTLFQWNMPCRDIFSGHEKIARVSSESVVKFLSEDLGVVDAIRRFEEEYVVSILNHWKSFTPQLYTTEYPTAWKLQLCLWKEKTLVYSFVFFLNRAEANKEFAKVSTQRAENAAHRAAHPIEETIKDLLKK